MVAFAQVPTSEVLVEAVEVQKGQWQYYRKYPFGRFEALEDNEALFKRRKNEDSVGTGSLQVNTRGLVD